MPFSPHCPFSLTVLFTFDWTRQNNIPGKFFYGVTIIAIFAPFGQRYFVQKSHVDKMKGGERLCGCLSTGFILNCQKSLFQCEGKNTTFLERTTKLGLERAFLAELSRTSSGSMIGYLVFRMVRVDCTAAEIRILPSEVMTPFMFTSQGTLERCGKSPLWRLWRVAQWWGCFTGVTYVGTSDDADCELWTER